MNGVAEPKPLERLREVVLREGPPLADSLIPENRPAVFASLAAGVSESALSEGQLAIVLEAVLEGYLLHYASPRLIDPPDPDLRLLTGDFLYAYALTRLTRAGDIDSIAELADLISHCAIVHAWPDHSAAEAFETAAALWSLAALAIAGGRWPAKDSALERLREAAPDDRREAVDAAHGVASERAARLGLELELEQALIAFRGMTPVESRQT